MSSATLNCLVTGATGFIGAQLCERLFACGATVVALSRHGAKLPNGAATQALDLAVQPLPLALLAAADVVFHLAGIAHQQAEPGAYAELNHRATVSLAKAAAQQGVKRFIYLSSVKAMGAPPHDAPRGEADCVLPTDPYGLSKLRAEQDLQALGADCAMSIVILRPCLVYGGVPKGNLAQLAKAVRAGLPRPPEVGGRSMIAVQDLAELMIAIATGPVPDSGTWIVCDGKKYSLRTLHDCMRQAANRSPARGWLPMWVWRLAAVAVDRMRGPDTESTYQKLFGTELYNNEALLRDFNWRPRLGLADAVNDTMKLSLEAQR